MIANPNLVTLFFIKEVTYLIREELGASCRPTIYLSSLRELFKNLDVLKLLAEE